MNRRHCPLSAFPATIEERGGSCFYAAISESRVTQNGRAVNNHGRSVTTRVIFRRAVANRRENGASPGGQNGGRRRGGEESRRNGERRVKRKRRAAAYLLSLAGHPRAGRAQIRAPLILSARDIPGAPPARKIWGTPSGTGDTKRARARTHEPRGRGAEGGKVFQARTSRR